MARNFLTRVGWTALATWAVASTAGLLVLHDRGAEQARRLEQLERAVSELRQARGVPGLAEKHPRSSGGAQDFGEARTAGLSEQELDTLATQVMALMEARQPVSNTPGSTAEPHVARGPEQQAALQRATGLVDQVLARGRLSQADIQDMRRELAPIDGSPEAEALRKRLVVALNLGTLIPDNSRDLLLP
jgi:hypothetical protein